MVKLIRNAFGQLKVLHLKNSTKQIVWKYMRELNDLQENEVLHLANKLRRAHISFFKQKMKVRLATQ